MMIVLYLFFALSFFILGFLIGKLHGVRRASEKMTALYFSEGVINLKQATKFYSLKQINKLSKK